MSDQVLSTPVKAKEAGSNGHKPHAATKWVYMFNEVDEAEAHVGGKWDSVRSLLGGKGANLGDMTRLGVPVPPGFTVTTEACNAYLNPMGSPKGCGSKSWRPSARSRS